MVKPYLRSKFGEEKLGRRVFESARVERYSRHVAICLGRTQKDFLVPYLTNIEVIHPA